MLPGDVAKAGQIPVWLVMHDTDLDSLAKKSSVSLPSQTTLHQFTGRGELYGLTTLGEARAVDHFEGHVTASALCAT